MSRTARYYRRSPFLVLYWKGNQLLYQNYLTGKLTAATPDAAAILDFCPEWTAIEAIFKRWPEYTSKSLRSSVLQLTRHTLLESSNRKPLSTSSRERALRQWGEWNPAAAFFHLSTKDAYTEKILRGEIQYISELMGSRSLPRPEKKYPGAPVIELPETPQESEFTQVLLKRRTCRKFSSRLVKREAFSTVMQLSFAVQKWLDVTGAGKLAQKTSPSGGALHPIEAYVMIRKVAGIRPGIYHYDAIGQKLQRIRQGVSTARIENYLAGQWWFREAAFVVFLTAMFGRTQWKYDYARAYRAILIEAGHLCQTFCLTATWLGLAPFCTIAMRDTAVESALKIDGISESVIYAMGAGVKPRGTL